MGYQTWNMAGVEFTGIHDLIDPRSLRRTMSERRYLPFVVVEVVAVEPQASTVPSLAPWAQVSAPSTIRTIALLSAIGSPSFRLRFLLR